MAIDIDALHQQIEALPQAIANDLQKELTKRFDKCGLYYRAFSRCKGAASTVKKMQNKKYDEIGKKMQDLIGVRIALYFKDDIDICVQILKDNYSVVEIVRDEETSDTFRPMRLNLVCKMPESILDQFVPEIWEFPIDKTFEVQVRTIFSEGWHEVEHDLRYKNKKNWDDHVDLSRNLNGILATLETCDWAILNVFDSLAYQKYKNRDWEAMLRNHLRIHINDSHLLPEISALFDKDQKLAKEFLRVDRKTVLLYLSHEKMISIPKKIDNIVFVINELIIKDSQISKFTPDQLKVRLSSVSTAILG